MGEWRVVCHWSQCHNGQMDTSGPQVTVNGTTVVLSGATGNVTGLALMNGVTYSVCVVARNSIGDSKTFTGSFRVPCE